MPTSSNDTVMKKHPNKNNTDSQNASTSKINISILGVDIKISLLALAFLIRLINVFTTKTYFVPDEYWQSWEVAHRYGYLTWEWQEKIRSFVHPGITAVIYYILKKIQWDSLFLLNTIPKIFFALMAAGGDYYTVLLAIRFFGKEVLGWATICTLSSWFHLFVSTRAISNSPETFLTTAAIYFWPWPHLATTPHPRSFEISLVLAALSCLLRPTAAIPWVYLGLRLIFKNKLALSRILLSVLFIAIVTISLMLVIDGFYYGHIVFVPWRFFQFNVTQNISSYYGISDWYFYLVLGLPSLLGTFIPFTALGCKTSQSKELLFFVATIVVAYSLLPHKELRFIYSVLPPLLAITAHGFQLYNRSLGSRRGPIISAIFSIQIIAAVYFNIWHQSGVVQVATVLHKDPTLESIGFLMPCHSTPYHAQIHIPLKMWFLTCHPPLGVADASNYTSVSDEFFNAPHYFVEHRFRNYTDDASQGHLQNPFVQANSASEFPYYFWPSHLVLFEALIVEHPELLKRFQNDQGYKLCHSLFNSHFHDDPRRRGKVLVYCKESNIKTASLNTQPLA